MIYGIHLTEWNKIKNNVRKRDDYICQYCKKIEKSTKHHVHHIVPYVISKNNDLENLITLCSSCHSKQHTSDKIVKILKLYDWTKSHIPTIENFTPPKWHLWVYGGSKRPL